MPGDATPGPWVIFRDRDSDLLVVMPAGRPGEICRLKISENGEANADVIRRAGSCATSPALNEPVRSKERAALDVALVTLRGIFNVGSGRPWAAKTALDRIAAILGEPTP